MAALKLFSHSCLSVVNPRTEHVVGAAVPSRSPATGANERLGTAAPTEMPVRHSDARARHRGLGLVELLVSLAISAALLTATAVALDASFKAYGANQEQATLTQRARLSLNRILTYIRTCETHQPHNATPRASFVAGAIVTDTGIDMLKDDGTAISFIYDSTNQQLQFKQGTTTAIMLNGVTSFSIKMEPMKSATNARSGGNYDLLMRATVLITLKTNAAVTGTGEDVGKQSLTISSSVMPRRNVW